MKLTSIPNQKSRKIIKNKKQLIKMINFNGKFACINENLHNYFRSHESTPGLHCIKNFEKSPRKLVYRVIWKRVFPAKREKNLTRNFEFFFPPLFTLFQFLSGSDKRKRKTAAYLLPFFLCKMKDRTIIQNFRLCSFLPASRLHILYYQSRCFTPFIHGTRF